MVKLQRILIVGSHALARAGLRAVLAEEPGIEVLAYTGVGGEMVPGAGEPAPHMLLIDRTMPGMNDIEAVAEMKWRYPDARVLMIMPHMTEDFISAVLQAGANGCIRQDATHEEFRLAIRSVLQGRSYPDMDLYEEVVNACSGGMPFTAGSALNRLTPREREVLKLVAAGKSSRNIAECFNLSVKTVGKHRANLMAKLDLHNSAGLTAYAIQRGLLLQ